MNSTPTTFAGAAVWRRVRQGDAGYAAILVISTMSLLALVVPLMLSLALRDIDDSKRHHGFDAAQDAARSGIQAVLAALTVSPAYNVGPTVTADVAQSGWAPQSAQYEWARRELLAQVTPTSTVVRTTPTGKYVVLRPANQRVIYALGWPLDGTAAIQGKILVAEYTYPTRSPGAALLAGSEVYLSGSFDMTRAPDSTLPADVHTNGCLTGTASSVTVDGSVSAVGGAGCPNGTTGASSRVIPTVDPAQYYAAYSITYATRWYDLCPDGYAYSVSPSGMPCSDGVKITTPLENWDWNSSSLTWSERGAGGPSGVYYVYGADVKISISSSVNQTIITEATKDGTRDSANLTCPKGATGTITVSQGVVQAFIPGAALVSGNNIELDSQGASYGGVVAAQEYVTMSSSASPGVTGYVIAQNSCPGPRNSFQGSKIVYYPTPGFLSTGPPRITAETELLQG